VVRTVEVSGCVDDPPILDAPFDAAAASTFTVHLDPQAGPTAEWSVENGSVHGVSADTRSVDVVAGTSGVTKVSVRVEQKPGCFTSATTDVAIVLPLSQCAIPPAATLSYVSHDCDSAIMRATFTGNGPFAGEWSDGTPFRVSAETIHEFKGPGTYTIQNFRDLSCFGTVTGEKTITRFKPTARLTGEDSCGTASLVATFEGVAPFSGTWADGTPFTTNETTLARTVQTRGPDTADHWVVGVTDAACKTVTYSNEFVMAAVPSVRAPVYPSCQTDPSEGATISGYFDLGEGPYRIMWTDGVETVSPFSRYAERRLPPTTLPKRSLEIEQAFAGQCPARITQSIAKVLVRPSAQIQPAANRSACTGEVLHATLSQLPREGSTIEWDFGVGQILSGQGTPSVTFTSNNGGTHNLTVKTLHADGFCNTTSNKVAYQFTQFSTVKNVQVAPTTIKVGGTANITWDQINNPTVTLTSSRSSDTLVKTGCCSATFVDKGGAGTASVKLEWYDPCRGVQSETFTITVKP
jgi:hypothetical protein